MRPQGPKLSSPNNLPVREVNRTINITEHQLLCKITAIDTTPNTHWCAADRQQSSSVFPFVPLSRPNFQVRSPTTRCFVLPLG